MNYLGIGLLGKTIEYPSDSLVIAREANFEVGRQALDREKDGLNPLPMKYRKAREFAAAVFPRPTATVGEHSPA